MKVSSLKPFDDGKYLSEEEALKLLESIPIPKDEPKKEEIGKLSPPEISPPPEIIWGKYFEVIKAAIPETIRTSAELQKARVELNARKGTSLNHLAFYTANVPLYGVENSKAFLLFGEREAFLRLYVPHIDEVYAQLDRQQNYILPPADRAWALGEGIRSGALKRFDLAELVETRQDAVYGFFTMAPNMTVQLNGARRDLAQLIFGQGDAYFEGMQMLVEKGISETKIGLLNPDYVISHAGNNLLGRASSLSNFANFSCFIANINYFNYDNRLLGVRLGAAGTTPKNGGAP